MRLISSKFRILELFMVGAILLVPSQLVSAETLTDIDQEIQTDKTFKSDRDGLDAFNIYEGVTNSRLDRKIVILQGSGINRRFFKTGSGGTDYTNFYSFTSRIGVTDTKLDLVTTDATLRLYRRGNSRYKEATGFLGSWWGDLYRGIQGSRDEQAILVAWGSDLQRIYVIDVPAGHTLVGGIASPMEKNGEYRNGGAYQYYYRGAPTDWLVYALYAPDYLKSYSGAVTSSQKAGRNIVTDLGEHLNQTRYATTTVNRHLSDTGDAKDVGGELWLRGFGGTIDYEEKDGSSVDSQTLGMSIGWQRMLSGISTDQSRAFLGVMFGQAVNVQKFKTSTVENTSRATVGGIYGLYMNNLDGPRSWYGSGSLLYGGLRLNNTVPGELGYGLNQDYNGNIAMFTIENGISFRYKNSWVLEPQQQFSYTKIGVSDFNDNLGANVSLKQGDSFWGRFGIELRKSFDNINENQSIFWARISYIHDFSSRNEVSVAGDIATSELYQNRYVLAVGTDLKINQRLSLQGQIVQVFDGERGLQGNLSVTYNW